MGEPGNREKQRSVLMDSFKALQTIQEPGGHLQLPYRWEAPPVMWRGRGLVEGSFI